MTRRQRHIQLEGYEQAPEVRPPVPVLPHRECLIAIDFDRTFTSDRRLWRAVILAAIASGHRVICVTNRPDNVTNRRLLEQSFGRNVFPQLAGVVYCNHQPKRRMAGIYGFRPDIWIDDMPEVIAAASSQDVYHYEKIYPEKETIPLV